MDHNLVPSRDVPMWGETRWNGCYSPESGVGVFLHAGRLRHHLDWWWVQTIVFLPGGRLVVDRSFTPDGGNPVDGLKTHNVEVRTFEGGWTVTFDGVAELTTSDRLIHSAAGASAPSVPVRFTINGRTTRPLWDLYGGGNTDQHFAGDMHWEQGCDVDGWVELPGERLEIDGVGFYDHSAGARNWSNWDHHHFTFAVMPDFTLHAIRAVNADGSPVGDPVGVLITDDGRQLRLTKNEMPDLEDLHGAPREFELLIGAEGMEDLPIAVEILHVFPNTITEENDNINGIDWQVDPRALAALECMARLTTPDGRVGYAHIERARRLASFDSMSRRALQVQA